MELISSHTNSIGEIFYALTWIICWVKISQIRCYYRWTAYIFPYWHVIIWTFEIEVSFRTLLVLLMRMRLGWLLFCGRSSRSKFVSNCCCSPLLTWMVMVVVTTWRTNVRIGPFWQESHLWCPPVREEDSNRDTVSESWTNWMWLTFWLVFSSLKSARTYSEIRFLTYKDYSSRQSERPEKQQCT